ncbi:hypothetical protein JM78_12365 [Burkholderia pyrrocinia]|nr:hypothetical protein JM78_12365 [Burkholderia pyrrocinia]
MRLINCDRLLLMLGLQCRVFIFILLRIRRIFRVMPKMVWPPCLMRTSCLLMEIMSGTMLFLIVM